VRDSKRKKRERKYESSTEEISKVKRNKGKRIGKLFSRRLWTEKVILTKLSSEIESNLIINFLKRKMRLLFT
jgi:hypothetical protein